MTMKHISFYLEQVMEDVILKAINEELAIASNDVREEVVDADYDDFLYEMWAADPHNFGPDR